MNIREAADLLSAWFRCFRHIVGNALSWLSASYNILTICYVLLGLYSLPMLVILAAFAMSEGFTKSSELIEFSMAIARLYASDVRETLGTFVVPFITAYAVAGVQREARIEARTLCLFLTLVIMFIISIIVYGAVTTRIDLMLGQTSVEPSVLSESKNQFLSMSASYVKELLVYISLLIGISQAGRAGGSK